MAKYSIVSGWDPFDNKRFEILEAASDEQLTQWANDPNCKQRDSAEQELADRRKRHGIKEANSKNLEAQDERRRLARNARRDELLEYPFDPRGEVSADTKYLVRNLWLIFVLCPIAIVLLYAILFAIYKT